MICPNCGKDAKDETYCPRCGQRVQPYEHVVARSVVPDKRAPVSGSDPAKPDVCRNCGTFVGNATTCYQCGASLISEAEAEKLAKENKKKFSRSGKVAICMTAISIGLLLLGFISLCDITSDTWILPILLTFAASGIASIPAVVASIITHVNGRRKGIELWRKAGLICLILLILVSIFIGALGLI